MIFLMSIKGDDTGFTIRDGKSMLIFYINQTYWIITTLSTVGYGDFNADGDVSYMILLIFIELFGLIAFSKIVGDVFTNKSETTVQEIIDFQKQDMSEMLLTLSKARGTQESLPEAVYEETRSFIEDTIRHSTDTFLHKSHFYHSLSPRLQNKIVRQVLFKQIN